MDNVKKTLQEYIEENILPVYQKNSKAHNGEHVNEVLLRAFALARKYYIDYNILYTAVCYHDIGDHVFREQHEIISSVWVRNDNNLRVFFSEEEIETICEAIEDHRASLDGTPRSIYGKILSSADRNVSVLRYFERSFSHSLEKNPNGEDHYHLEDLYKHALKKFGENGYAVTKYYIADEAYSNYLQELQDLLVDKEKFETVALPVLEKEKKKIK